MLNRRSLLTSAAGAAVGVAGVASLLPVSHLAARAHLLAGTPEPGDGDLGYARQIATELAVAYVATPSTDVVDAAREHAYTLLGMLKRPSMADHIRTELAAIASDAASLAGYGNMNAGRLGQADAWFAEALALARQAGDQRLEALALLGAAWPALQVPDPDRAAAVVTLEAAARLQRFLPPAARAYVFGSLAVEHAELGDDLGSGRLLEHAQTAAARIPLEEPGWGWWSVHGELNGLDAGPRPKVYTSRRLSALGHSADALELFDATLDGTTAPVRRSHLHQFVMGACVDLGDPDRACTSGVAALTEAKAHGIGVIGPKVRKVRTAFPPHWNLYAQVRELDELLRAVA